MKELLTIKEPKNHIASPSDLFKRIEKINIDYAQENFIVFFLDTRNKLISVENLFKGGLNSCLIDGRIIYRRALLLNANSLIFAHNHPSGNLSFSEEDIKIYELLKKGAETLQFSVLDNIVFNKKEFYRG